MRVRHWLIALSILLVPVVMFAFRHRRGDVVPAASPGAPARAPDSTTAPGVPDEVTGFLRNGQSWRAARRMREVLRGSADPAPEAVLLAARAEAGWGGWSQVRAYLEGRPWLDRVRHGEGWYWLGRAFEEDERWESALDAYARYLALEAPAYEEERRRIAELRRGRILLREGQPEQGVELLEGVRTHAPEVAPWMDVLAAEALAKRGDTTRVRSLLEGIGEDPQSALWRARQALIDAYEEAGDLAGARDLALAFGEQRESASGRASLAARAARLSLAIGDTAVALRELRSAVRVSPGSSAARDAALLLERMPALNAADRLAIAGVLDQHGSNRRAADGYRSWLSAGAGSAAEREAVRLRLGQALFDAGDFAAAERELRPLAGSASAERAASALHLIGRSQYRSGQRSRATATFLDAARRFPRTRAGAESLFLVADLSHDAGEATRARALYRRVASEFPGTDRAGLSLMRLAGAEFLNRDFGAAAAAWDEYREAYPAGERWLESTYWSGRAREAAGDTAAARGLYRAVRERDPLSYYALRAGERLGQPYWPIPLAESPVSGEDALRRVEEWMRGVDLLRSAGLRAEAEAEVGRRIAQAQGDPDALYALAEALIERGYTVEGIRVGIGLQRRERQPNLRMLRILYPFPYRSMIEAEAGERSLDPFLVAALTRQESLFKAGISSPVGARGLMQVMPNTGEILARAAGIQGWDADLLFNPEINVHLGTRYLAEQMRQYGGSLPSVFSAYNAGPYRVQQWKKFPEYRDEELFTERIPYRETRDYVKILTRNIALYRGLYGGESEGEGP